MRRIKKKWIFVPTIVILLILAFTLIYREQQKITGVEWLAVQETYVDQMADYADNMDTIFALYIGESISQEDFLNHVEILEDELLMMDAARNEMKQEYIVKTGTHTYSSKKGCEAVDQCYKTLEDILAMAKENCGDIEALSYKYLAYHQTIIDELAEYMTAMEFITEEED